MFDLLTGGLKMIPVIIGIAITALLLSIFGLIGGTVGLVAMTVTIVGTWVLWEKYMYDEGELLFVGRMISGWRNVDFDGWYGWDTVGPIALNLLLYYRLIFILPLAYLHL